MTEDSFYWSGTTADSPGDAGVYAESTMWRNLAQIAIAGNAESDSDLYNVGVFYSVGNQLEVTLDGVNLDVDTGAGLVDGTYYENDASVDITVDAAAAGDERIDYIVLRKCYEGSTYNPGGNVPAVDEQEVRITVIKGTEVTPPAVPSAPSLTHDTGRATYWDVPLAQVDVDDTGATAVTDAREYVDAETKFIPMSVVGARNTTDGTDIGFAYDSGQQIMTFSFPDAKDSVATSNSVKLPNNYITDLYIYALVRGTAAGGDLYGTFWVLGDECDGTLTGSSTSTTAARAISAGANDINCLSLDASAAGFSAGDIIRSSFIRNGNNASDTLNSAVEFIGFYAQYLGWKW